MNKMRNYLDNYKKAPITFSLITISVIVYLISFLLYGMEMNTGQAISFGGYNPLLVYYYHDYYRLISSQFIHFGFIHLLMNCYSLYGLGRFLESVLKKNYIIVIIGSALCTTGIPYILFLINGFEMNVISGGISGIIFGLIGSLGALALLYKDVFLSIFKDLALNIVMMLALSFIVPSISLSGHVSGMIGGFVFTYVLLKVKDRKNKYNNLVN